MKKIIEHICPDHPLYMCNKCLKKLEIKKEETNP